MLDVASRCPDSGQRAMHQGAFVQEEEEKIGGMLLPEGWSGLPVWKGGMEGGGVGMAWHGMTG